MRQIFMGVVCSLTFVPVLLQGGEVELEHAGQEFDCLDDFLPRVINDIISGYYVDRKKIYDTIVSFVKLCPQSSPLLFSLSQIYFVRQLLNVYQYSTASNSLAFQQGGRAQRIFASLPTELIRCIITKFKEKTPPHDCDESSPWCAQHIRAPYPTPFLYHTTSPRPLSLNNRGDVIAIKTGLFHSFPTCIFKNGNEVALVQHLKDFEHIPMHLDGAAIWLTGNDNHNDNHAVLFHLYPSEHIPKDIFSFRDPHKDTIMDPYLCTCDIIDVSQNGKVVQHGVSAVPANRYAEFLNNIFQPAAHKLPLYAQYHNDTQALYVETARTHLYALTQVLIHFPFDSRKKIFSFTFYSYPCEFVPLHHESVRYHISHARRSSNPPILLTPGGAFFHTKSAHMIPTEPNINVYRIDQAPILWNEAHSYTLIPTYSSADRHIVWNLLNIRDKKDTKHK